VVSGGPAPEAALTLVSGGTPAPVAVAEPAPVAAAPVAAPEANTNVLAPVNPTVDSGAPAAAAAPEKSSQQKEEELLSEFEKMLAS